MAVLVWTTLRDMSANVQLVIQGFNVNWSEVNVETTPVLKKLCAKTPQVWVMSNACAGLVMRARAATSLIILVLKTKVHVRTVAFVFP